MIDALGYKSWMEPLDAYKFLVQMYTLLTLFRSRITVFGLVELQLWVKQVATVCGIVDAL